MKKSITYTVPTDWSDINLKKWLELQKELENYKDDEEAQGAVMLNVLCGISADIIPHLPKGKFDSVKERINKLPDPTKLPLKRFVVIDGVEYGLEPNLSEMTYACYADITQYETAGIDKNWGKIMSILYRPVVRKLNGLYEIEPYRAKIDDSIWLEQGMDLHFGTMFFFLATSMDLYKDTLKFLRVEGIPPSIRQTLEKSGRLIIQFMNSQTEIYQGLTKL
jgi:hypothetical protein